MDIWPFLIAFFLTLIAVPITIKFARHFKLVDDPNLRPHPAHVHKKAIPRAGGLAIYIGVVLTIFILLPLTKALVGIILGITILLIMGLIDDKIPRFNPYLRLFLLFLSAGIVVASGIGISFITNPLPQLIPQTGGYLHFDQIIIPFTLFGPHRFIPFADLLAFLLIVTLTQVINWSKGVDGQMPGITLVTSLTLGFLSLKLFSQGDLNQLNVAKLAFIVAGSSLAFLIFNWHPAKIFPGFSGSTILAFLLAVLSILSGAKIATALLVLAVPMADFIYLFFKRIFKGHSPVWGDRGHLHHRLLDLGWSHQQIALFYILGSAILGLVSLIVDTRSKVFALMAVATIFALFVLWINSFGHLSKKSDPDNG